MLVNGLVAEKTVMVILTLRIVVWQERRSNDESEKRSSVSGIQQE